MAEFGNIVSRCLLESQNEASRQGIIAFAWAQHRPKKPGMTLKWFPNAMRDSKTFPRKLSTGEPSSNHEYFSKRLPFYETEAAPNVPLQVPLAANLTRYPTLQKKKQTFYLRQVGQIQLHAICPESAQHAPRKLIIVSNGGNKAFSWLRAALDG